MSETVEERDAPMKIEWWENEGQLNWHAVSNNGRILFGSTQGYENRTEALQYLGEWFPHLEIVSRDPIQPSHLQAQVDNPRSEGDQGLDLTGGQELR
jgi:hypothetical protein